MRNSLRQRRLDFFLDVLVDQVAFGDGQNPILVQKFGVIFLKLVEQGLVACLDVVLFRGDHKEQHRVPFDVAEEAYSYASSFVRPFYDSRDIRHYK